MTDPARTPAEENMDRLLDALAGKPRMPLRRAGSDSAEPLAQYRSPVIDASTGAGGSIDSEESLRALMDTIHRSSTPSTDPKRLAIADAIARYLGIDCPALHAQSRDARIA